MAEEAQERTEEEQIGDMLESAPVEEEEVVEEEVVEEETLEVEEPVVEEVEEVIDDVVEEDSIEPETEEVVDEEETRQEEDAEVVDGAEVSADIQGFRDRINQIAEAALKQGVALPEFGEDEFGEEAPAVAAPPVVDPVVPVAPATVPQSYDNFDILMGGVDFDSFIDNEENFVKGMRSILARQEQMLSQRFMQAIPNIVQNQTKQVVALQTAVDKFYQVNSDLEPVRATVGAVATQIETKHPDWSIAKVMEESAKSTRKLLRLPSPKSGKSNVVKPSFAKPGKTQQRNKQKLKMSKLQKEIDDLI